LSQLVKSTERLASVFLVAAVFISLGSFPGVLAGYQGYAQVLLASGVFLVMVSLSMMGYATYTLSVLTSSRVEGVGGRGFEGDEVEVGYRICNRGSYPLLFVELLLEHPPHLRLVRGSRRALAVIPPKGCANYRAWFEGRTGAHLVGPLKAVVRDPLGLFRSDELELGRPVELRVMPRHIPAAYREAVALSRAVGIARSRVAGSGTEFLSVREYREGDEPRRIVWRYTARWGRLAVKETEKETSASVAFILPIEGSGFEGPYRETPFEAASRIIATIARSLALRGDSVFLIALGRGFIVATERSRGFEGYRRILSAISRTRFSRAAPPPDEGDYKAFSRAIARHFREGGLALLFLYPTMDPKLASSIAERVGRAVRASGGAIYSVIPTPDLGLAAGRDLAYKLEVLRMLRGSIEVSRASTEKGVLAVVVSQREVARIARIVELAGTP